ncbi:hypothetical protein Nos7524_2174 [Nostoc sp. PCC 7524]|uniref:hypothetical protein n=1 Tax=Nostoc sp. (strain ATCC 29411 / PCC 7524) TaxID=28072 RepID=UPI00029F1BBF|nr:hypothetical protein [Nostoc sp. PCC 7524]AFY48022.1 hypothetical protein Nos7524_2174 [Nostoc sp. PCC 7524]
MTIKEKLLKEIESTSDTILAETLDFLRFLKTKETAINLQAKNVESANHTAVHSTGNSLLKHLETIGKWEGDDLEECLQSVIASRGKAKFDDDNPFK